ncbi:MAG: MBL fold metallo-hydrolase [Candidatus Brocadiales bacterium]
MKIKFWGVRGTIPTWRKDVKKFGGSTSCLQVFSKGGKQILLDSGTGILNLSRYLRQSKDLNRKDPIHLFLTHTHYDHVLGLPFFLTLFREVPIHIYLHNKERSVEDVISSFMSKEFCPIRLDGLSKVYFNNITERKTVSIPPFEINCIKTIHPSYCMGFGIKVDNKRCVYITDHELPPAEDKKFAKYVKFCRHADILIHDAQYTPGELSERVGWGHSSYDRVVQLAIASEVSKLVLFHHDPDHSDKVLHSILTKSKRLLKEGGIPVRCYLAKESWEIEV